MPELSRHLQTLQDLRRLHGAQFVPRRDATAEDDGYILLLLHNGETGGTEFAILDAQRISDGAARKVQKHLCNTLFSGHFPKLKSKVFFRQQILLC